MPSTRSVVVAMWALFGAARATLCSSSLEGTWMYEGAIARGGVRLAQTNAGGLIVGKAGGFRRSLAIVQPWEFLRGPVA